MLLLSAMRTVKFHCEVLITPSWVADCARVSGGHTRERGGATVVVRDSVRVACLDGVLVIEAVIGTPEWVLVSLRDLRAVPDSVLVIEKALLSEVERFRVGALTLPESL